MAVFLGNDKDKKMDLISGRDISKRSDLFSTG